MPSPVVLGIALMLVAFAFVILWMVQTGNKLYKLQEKIFRCHVPGVSRAEIESGRFVCDESLLTEEGKALRREYLVLGAQLIGFLILVLVGEWLYRLVA